MQHDIGLGLSRPELRFLILSIERKIYLWGKTAIIYPMVLEIFPAPHRRIGVLEGFSPAAKCINSGHFLSIFAPVAYYSTKPYQATRFPTIFKTPSHYLCLSHHEYYPHRRLLVLTASVWNGLRVERRLPYVRRQSLIYLSVV